MEYSYHTVFTPFTAEEKYVRNEQVLAHHGLLPDSDYPYGSSSSGVSSTATAVPELNGCIDVTMTTGWQTQGNKGQNANISQQSWLRQTGSSTVQFIDNVYGFSNIKEAWQEGTAWDVAKAVGSTGLKLVGTVVLIGTAISAAPAVAAGGGALLAGKGVSVATIAATTAVAPSTLAVMQVTVCQATSGYLSGGDTLEEQFGRGLAGAAVGYGVGRIVTRPRPSDEKIHQHHSVPKYLQGDPKQKTTAMPASRHYKLHRDIDRFAPRRLGTDHYKDMDALGIADVHGQLGNLYRTKYPEVLPDFLHNMGLMR